MASDGISLGKGAWDCDKNIEIPPEKEVRSEDWCSDREREWRGAKSTSAQQEVVDI